LKEDESIPQYIALNEYASNEIDDAGEIDNQFPAEDDTDAPAGFT